MWVCGSLWANSSWGGAHWERAGLYTSRLLSASREFCVHRARVFIFRQTLVCALSFCHVTWGLLTSLFPLVIWLFFLIQQILCPQRLECEDSCHFKGWNLLGIKALCDLSLFSLSKTLYKSGYVLARDFFSSFSRKGKSLLNLNREVSQWSCLSRNGYSAVDGMSSGERNQSYNLV